MLTADRDTPYKDGNLLTLAVLATITIFGGAMVAKRSNGYAAPASDLAGTVVVGVATEQVTGGAANGDKKIVVRRNKVFLLVNDTANPVTITHIGTNVFVKDDETVSSNGGTNNVIAGKCVGVDALGVYVEI